jgi:hypothetical protein
MIRRPTPFSERLALARQMVARRAQQPPVHLADQFSAAGREVLTLHDRLMMVLPQIEPDRRWHQRLNDQPSDEVRAYLLAALLGCTTDLRPPSAGRPAAGGGPPPAALHRLHTLYTDAPPSHHGR